MLGLGLSLSIGSGQATAAVPAPPRVYDSGTIGGGPVATHVTTAIDNGMYSCLLTGGTGGTRWVEGIAATYGKATIIDRADPSKTFDRAQLFGPHTSLTAASTLFTYNVRHVLLKTALTSFEGGSQYTTPTVGTYGVYNLTQSGALGPAHQGVGLGNTSYYLLGHDANPYVSVVDRSTATVTFDSTTDAVTWTGHGLSATDMVVFTNSGGGVAAGLTAGTRYFVKTVLDANSFTLAASSGGPLIDLTSNGTGTNTGRKVIYQRTTVLPTKAHLGPPVWYNRTVSGQTGVVAISGNAYPSASNVGAIHFLQMNAGMTRLKTVNIDFSGLTAPPSGSNTDKTGIINMAIRLGAASDGSDDIAYFASYWNETVASVAMSAVLAASDGDTISATLVGFMPQQYAGNTSDGLFYDPNLGVLIVSGSKHLLMDPTTGQFRGEMTNALTGATSVWGSGGQIDAVSSKYGFSGINNSPATDWGKVDFVDAIEYPVPLGSTGARLRDKHGLQFVGISIPDAQAAFSYGAVTVPTNVTASTFVKLSNMGATNIRADLYNVHNTTGFMESDQTGTTGTARFRNPGPTTDTTCRGSPTDVTAVGTRSVFGMTWNDANAAGSKGVQYNRSSDSSGNPGSAVNPAGTTSRSAWPSNAWLGIGAHIALPVPGLDLGFHGVLDGELTLAQWRSAFVDDPGQWWTVVDTYSAAQKTAAEAL